MSPPMSDGPKFVATVADAVHHLWDYDYLGMSPLVELPCVKRRLTKHNGRSHLDTGRIINDILLNAIDNLKPADPEPSRSRQRLYHTIFMKAYVERLDKKTVAASLGISKRTLYRHSSHAIPIIAKILREWSL